MGVGGMKSFLNNRLASQRSQMPQEARSSGALQCASQGLTAESPQARDVQEQLQELRSLLFLGPRSQSKACAQWLLF